MRYITETPRRAHVLRRCTNWGFQARTFIKKVFSQCLLHMHTYHVKPLTMFLSVEIPYKVLFVCLRPQKYLNWSFIAWTSLTQCIQHENGPRICINWHFRVTRDITESPRHAQGLRWCTNWGFWARTFTIKAFTHVHNWSDHTSTHGIHLIHTNMDVRCEQNCVS